MGNEERPSVMDHAAHQSLNRAAFSATIHCLTGCAIGEILGLVIATAAGWSTVPSIAIAVVLAFTFGYAFTLGPVLRAGVPVHRALPLAFASDTASITVMEIVDNAFILIVPGAMEASAAADAETSTWPPWPAAAIRAARRGVGWQSASSEAAERQPSRDSVEFGAFSVG